MNMRIAEKIPPSTTEALNTPPVVNPLDAEVDMELLKVVPKRFAIVDEGSANWLVRKIVGAREYGKHVKQWAQREQHRAEREEMTLMFLFGRQIEMWTRDEIERLGSRRKSICVPAGTLAFRRLNAKLIVDNEIKLMEWARANCPVAIQVSERLLKEPINDHFSSTGELPDGAHLEPERETFSIS